MVVITVSFLRQEIKFWWFLTYYLPVWCHKKSHMLLKMCCMPLHVIRLLTEKQTHVGFCCQLVFKPVSSFLRHTEVWWGSSFFMASVIVLICSWIGLPEGWLLLQDMSPEWLLLFICSVTACGVILVKHGATFALILNSESVFPSVQQRRHCSRSQNFYEFIPFYVLHENLCPS